MLMKSFNWIFVVGLFKYFSENKFAVSCNSFQSGSEKQPPKYKRNKGPFGTFSRQIVKN